MSVFDQWMRFHVGDYLADTMHLTTFQHGIYLLLIMHYFKRGELPDDEAALARIAKVSVYHWRRSAPAVLALFYRDSESHYRHLRCDSERERARELSEKRRVAGKQGAMGKWAMANATSDDGNSHSPAPPRARAYQNHDKNLPPNPPADRHAEGPPRTAGTPAGGADDLVEETKRAAGTNPRAAGTNPRANGTAVRGTSSAPSRGRQTGWTDIAADDLNARLERAAHAEAADAYPGGAGVVHLPRRTYRH